VNITIRYGTDSMNKQFDGTPTVSTVLHSASVKAQLGFGDNVRALVNGVALDEAAPVEDGSIVVVETKANSKAV